MGKGVTSHLIQFTLFCALVTLSEKGCFAQEDIHCEWPSLPPNSLHIIVAGHRKEHIHKHYLFNLGLTNTELFFYRREDESDPVRELQGPCGIKAYERLVLPNHGREATAFYDYAIEHYRNPPRAIMFLHGHAFIGEHLTCNSGFSRALKYYRDMVENSSFSRMVTLTEYPHKPIDPNDPFQWAGTHFRHHHSSRVHQKRNLGQIDDTSTEIIHEAASRIHNPVDYRNIEICNKNIRKLRSVAEEPYNLVAGQECVNVFVKNNQSARAPGPYLPYQDMSNLFVYFRPDIKPDGVTDSYMRSCCPSFIMGGERLKWYPLKFYQDMRQYFLNSTMRDQNQGWLCFEYVIWDLFADIRGVDTTIESERKWYEEAAELVDGSNSGHSEHYKKALEECLVLQKAFKYSNIPEGKV